jgi:RNA polymerase sigma factor (sigma-70 family)
MNDLIRTVLGPGRPGQDPLSSDAELLAAYTRDGDHVAFARLVERHGPMVYAVCRRLLSDPNDADDAFQAVFLVFIRRAGSLRGGRLAGWFYGVALRTAKEARKVTARRQRLDEKYRSTRPSPETEPADPIEAEDLRAVLDRELSRLTESARAAIILCDMEGRTRKEAAAELGCPEGTLATRLARARELLASRLARLGIALGVSGLLVFLASESRAAVPLKLKQEILAFPSAVSVGPAVLALASRAVVKTGWLRTTLLGTGVVGVVAVTVTGLTWGARPGGDGPGGDRPGVAGPAPAPWPRVPARQGPPEFSLVAGNGQKSTIMRDSDGTLTEKPGSLPPGAVVSRDGKRFVRIDAEGKFERQIFVGEVGKEPRGGEWRRPPPSPVDGDLPRSLEPSWSPDSTRIIFLLDPTCSCMMAPYKGLVMILDLDSNRYHPSVASETLLAKPKFHPDGRRIAVLHEVAREGNRPIYDLILHTLSAGRTKEALLTKTPVLDYAFSPDGDRIAVSVVGRGLVILELGSHKQALLPLPVQGIDSQLDLGELLWRPDGKVIAFRPVFVRGMPFTGAGLTWNPSPREVKNQDRVGFIRVSDPPSVESFITLDTGFRLSHWQTEPPVRW